MLKYNIIFSPRFFLDVRDQVWRPYKIAGKILVFHTLVFVFRQ
jgi:hypothetical protein